MERKKVGLITLAVTLISLGGFLLLNNFTNMNLSLFLSLLLPGAIILLGLEIIITKVIVDREDHEIKLHIHKGSIILLIVIVGVTSLVSMADRVVIFPFRLDVADIINGNNPFYEFNTTYEEEFEVAIDDEEELTVDNIHGDVEIRKGDTNKVKVRAIIEMEHNDQEYADVISKDIVRGESKGNRIEVESRLGSYNHDNGIGNIRTSLYIEVPSNLEIKVNNKFGEIYVTDMDGKVKLNNAHGNVTVENIGGLLEIDNSYDKVKVGNIRNDVIITNRHGEVSVNTVEGDLKIRNSYDSVEVEGITGNVEITNSHNEVNIKNIGGNLEIVNSFGDVEVENVSKRIDIENSHGNVELSNNRIFVENVHIVNQFGNIELDILAEQEGEFSAYTRHGRINSDLDIEIDEDTSEETLKGEVGNSNIDFELETQNGDIKINKK